MSIASVVTRGYGPWATIPFVVTRGYTIGAISTEAKYHTVKLSLATPNMTFASTQRKTTFNLETPSVIMDMIEEPTITEFILLTDGSFLLLTTGDKVIRNG